MTNSTGSATTATTGTEKGNHTPNPQAEAAGNSTSSESTSDTLPQSSVRLDSIETALAEIAAGRCVVVVDDENRENEGDLILAAETATAESIAFMVRYSSGYICVGMSEADCDRLGLPPMVALNEDARSTAYTVTVDAKEGTTTGISATDRAYTIRLLAKADSTPSDFTRPGHVVPLRARRGGVLTRGGHTEASVDLARMAGLHPSGALCEIVSEKNPTDMARADELREFADRHNLAMISIEQLVNYRRRTEALVEQVTQTALPTAYGDFEAYGYRNIIDGNEHVALVVGDITSNGGEDVLVRVHSECLTGDVFGSRRCDCGDQLHAAMETIMEAGRGVILYMRGHEGRGIGLISKLEAYRLQDQGFDTVDANVKLGHPADAREFGTSSAILADLGISSIVLLSNNPTKVEGLSGHGIKVSRREGLEVGVYPQNFQYLKTKRDRMGHDLPSVEAWEHSHTAR